MRLLFLYKWEKRFLFPVSLCIFFSKHSSLISYFLTSGNSLDGVRQNLFIVKNHQMLQLKSIQLFDQLQFFGTLKVGQNDREIPNLEFESHCFLENQVFLPAEQAGTNICGMIYQGINFKICLSLFGWRENILPKEHIVQCRRDHSYLSLSFFLLFF